MLYGNAETELTYCEEQTNRAIDEGLILGCLHPGDILHPTYFGPSFPINTCIVPNKNVQILRNNFARSLPTRTKIHINKKDLETHFAYLETLEPLFNEIIRESIPDKLPIVREKFAHKSSFFLVKKILNRQTHIGEDVSYYFRAKQQPSIFIQNLTVTHNDRYILITDRDSILLKAAILSLKTFSCRQYIAIYRYKILAWANHSTQYQSVLLAARAAFRK